MLTMILVLFATSAAFAAPAKSGVGLTIDGSISVADETYEGSDAGFGFGFGVSYDLSDVVKLGDSKLLARADVNILQGEQDLGFLGTLDSSRMPFFVGARYVLPINTQPLDLFAEAGLELSFDKYEVVYPFFAGLKNEVSDTNLGLAPGFGAVFPLGSNLSLGANARLHLITNSYMSFSFSLGYSF
jgi:hypothetical protein